MPISDTEYRMPICLVPFASNFPRNFSSAGVKGDSTASEGALSVSCLAGAACSAIIFTNVCVLVYVFVNFYCFLYIHIYVYIHL